MVTFKRVEMEAALTQRGEYDLGPLIIRASDPFSFFRETSSLKALTRCWFIRASFRCRTWQRRVCFWPMAIRDGTG